MVLLTKKKQGLRKKWQLMTLGPLKVVHRVNLVNYVIQKTPRSNAFTCHVNRMRRFYGELSHCCVKEAVGRSQSRDAVQNDNQPVSTSNYAQKSSSTVASKDKSTSA